MKIFAVNLLIIALLISLYFNAIHKCPKDTLDSAIRRQVEHLNWVDTIYSVDRQGVKYEHYDTVVTYIVAKGKEDGENNSYSVTFQDETGITGYDFLDECELDTVLVQGKLLSKRED